MSHPLLNYWLGGTTCARRYVDRRVLLENDEYIVLHHGAHASYVDRSVGLRTCRAYSVLFRKADIQQQVQDFMAGRGALQTWPPRTTLTKIRADCAARGITFGDACA